MSPTSGADFLSAEGDSEDWLWRAVRRGVAPAFAPKALRCHTQAIDTRQDVLRKCHCALANNSHPNSIIAEAHTLRSHVLVYA